jgi:hypothetical protein
MHAKRKQLIYGNCQVLNPNGDLMFRCLEKRAKWYLNRNLATTLNEDPLIIKLNFQPKGNGERTEYLKDLRENKCIVCGETNLELLTKHHIIPYEYRKHFPYELKSHSSQYIVVLCADCHEKYENNYAKILKKELYQKYLPEKKAYKNIPKSKKIQGYLNAILNHKNALPSERYFNLVEKVSDSMSFFNFTPETEVNEIERYCELKYDIKNEVNNTRFKVYEIERFKKYCSLYYVNGNLTNIGIAQNPLTLFLKRN